MAKIVFVRILQQLLEEWVGNIKLQLFEMKAIFPAELPEEVECQPQPLPLFRLWKLLSFFTKTSEKKIILGFRTLPKRNLLTELTAYELFPEKVPKK
jgi:hypothetical protein